MSRIIKASHLVVVNNNNNFCPKDDEERVFSIKTAELLYEETKHMVEELISGAQEKGAEIIKNAQSEADRIIDIASREAENIKKQGYDEGYLAGQKQVYNDFKSKLEEADIIIQKAYQEREKILAGLEKEILNFSLLLAEKVLRKQIEERNDIIVNIAKDLLEIVQDAQSVTIKLCQEDYFYLNDFLPELQAIISQGTLKLEQDSTLMKGDCIIVSECGLVLAKIDGQLEKLKETLMEVNSYD
ncbi:MAG: FliH/SctL family protein [Bacillota bacterium]